MEEKFKRYGIILNKDWSYDLWSGDNLIDLLGYPLYWLMSTIISAVMYPAVIVHYIYLRFKSNSQHQSGEEVLLGDDVIASSPSNKCVSGAKRE